MQLLLFFLVNAKIDLGENSPVTISKTVTAREVKGAKEVKEAKEVTGVKGSKEEKEAKEVRDVKVVLLVINLAVHVVREGTLTIAEVNGNSTGKAVRTKRKLFCDTSSI